MSASGRWGGNIVKRLLSGGHEVKGRWTVTEALEEDVPAPVITLSLLERLRSRQAESFSAKVIAALQNEFGGHGFKKPE